MSHSHKVVLVWPRHSTHWSSVLVMHWLLRTDQTCQNASPVSCILRVTSCSSPKVHLVSCYSANLGLNSLYTCICTLWVLSALYTRRHEVTQCLTHSSHPDGVIITLAETCDILPATASTAKGLSFAVGVHKYHASSLPCPHQHVKLRAVEDC